MNLIPQKIILSRLLSGTIAQFAAVRNLEFVHTFRVLLVLAVWVAGIGAIVYLSDSKYVRTARTALFASVAMPLEEEERPVVLSGIVSDGEVSAAHEITLSAGASGFVTNAPRGTGTSIRAGELVIRVNTEDAERYLREAELALATARLTMRRASGATTEVLHTDIDGSKAATSRAITDGYVYASQALVSVSDIMEKLSGILYGGAGFDDDGMNYLVALAGIIELDSKDASPVVTRAGDAYVAAQRMYESTYALLHTEAAPGDTEREVFITRSNEMFRTLRESVGATKDLLSFVQNYRTSVGFRSPDVFDSYQEFLGDFEVYINEQLRVLEDTRFLIEEARAALQTDTVPPDLGTAELNVQRATLALDEARAHLARHDLRAPFPGTIARLDTRVHQYVEDGQPIALLVSHDSVVHTALVQADATHVHIGTRVQVSVADTDINLAGIVTEMSGVGRNDEDGLVLFDIVVGFPKPDERLKPGMEVRVGFES